MAGTKERYYSLMQKALYAYSDEDIREYFERVKRDGLKEHGFPRLTANIGIMISMGVRRELLPIFIEMMDFSCDTIPTVLAANDFSVREIVFCLLEIEKSGVLPKEYTTRWRERLASIDPLTTYTVYAKTPDEDVRNWALYTALSEFARQKAGLCDSSEFIDLQIASQLVWLDENGMYMDKKGSDINHPFMYDIVSRGLFTLLLHLGYRGRYFDRIDSALRKAALCTLTMQSVTGELPFGGRSNQFIHNEAWMAVIFEYEAKRYKASDPELASRFKAAAGEATAAAERWIDRKPTLHIKNRYPRESMYGCEFYAYFDKYMITVASFFYVASLIADDSIEAGEFDMSADVFATSHHFHKLFLRAGGYMAELDTNADPEYDASGLGRVHKRGAPSAICMSTPSPSNPDYKLDIPNPVAASLCPCVRMDGRWIYSCDSDADFEVISLSHTEKCASTRLVASFKCGARVVEDIYVDSEGVSISLSSECEIGFMLPAFDFDGEKNTEISLSENSLSISYEGWTCRYTVSGALSDIGKITANRNGHYRLFLASADKKLNVGIEILPNL